MQKVGTGNVKFFKYSELNPNEVLFERARYLESFQGKFGVVHKFVDPITNQELNLNSSGQLNYLIKTHLTEGQYCKVVYLGKVVLDKGAMKGKEAHNFELYTEALTLKPVSNKSSLDDLE
jgi:hypothetical protein